VEFLILTYFPVWTQGCLESVIVFSAELVLLSSVKLLWRKSGP